jgi:hypothetical protein
MPERPARQARRRTLNDSSTSSIVSTSFSLRAISDMNSLTSSVPFPSVSI